METDLKFWKFKGGATVVKANNDKLYMYSQMFYGNWKLFPPENDGEVKRFETEDELIEYLKNL